MPYTVPTVDDFLARWPIFGDSDSDLIQQMLDEAAGQIDISWREADYQPAILYLSAHLLATDNSDEGAEVVIGGSQGAIASESFGGMSISYATAGSADASANASQYGSTEYGRRFYNLLIKNRGGPLVV